ncbi:uncharacterized protein [Argopecten irradians]|uniref:uncharacterized protein n=1 Tax=Argopecten irradians TaxID=31199 RepID=UPI00371BD5F7
MATAKIPVRPKGQKMCLHHKDRQLELYCEKCQELACVKCVSTTHKAHALCDLSEITAVKSQTIRDFIDRTEQNDLVQVGDNISAADTLLKDNDRTFERLSDQLHSQTEKLKHELDKMTAETVAHYQKMKMDNSTLIQKYKEDLQMYEKQIKKQLQECKATLQQGSHIEIYDTECGMDSRLHLPVKPVLGNASFTANRNPRNYLQLALGTCQSEDIGETSTLEVKDVSVSLSHGQGQSSTQQSGGTRTRAVTSTKLLTETRVVEEWKSPCPITSICPTNGDQAWTSYEYSKRLTLLGRKGIVIQITHTSYINDICLSPSTHTLWVCDVHNNILELVSGKLSNRFKTKDGPKCMCVTADNHIIIGMSKHITKYTTHGQIVLNTLTTVKSKQLVFTPWSIAECPITNNVAVIDRSYKEDGGDGNRHVLVIDSDFQELFIYRSDTPTTGKQRSLIQGKPFDPMCIVYDGQGNIIIGDCVNNRILLLSGDGEDLRILHTDTDVIWAVSVSRQGEIWTANINDNVKLLQYYA